MSPPTPIYHEPERVHYPLLSLVDAPRPQRPRIPCRNRSRSSGVMCSMRSSMRASMRSAMRRRIPEPEKPRRPNPPKRIRHSARSASACQKVISRQPKSGGSSQFHSNITISPPRKVKSASPRTASGAMKSNRLLLDLMFSPSCVREFVVDALQSLAQTSHRVAFAGEQRIHAHASFGGDLLEAAPFHLVRHKHLALLLRQLADCQLEIIEMDLPVVQRFGSGMWRR